jgi:hypothetical protein
VLSVNCGAGVFVPVFLFLAEEYPSYEALFFDDDSLISFGVSLITC